MERGHAPGERSSDGDRYLLPRHPAEVDRLDVQHYAMRDALGANYLAPLAHPALILDVGCGTGQWAFELCSQFPDAMVAGLDLEPSKPKQPANYRFVRGNVLSGLPFGDDRFDFVHQRLLQSGVPLASWSGVVNELVRVTRPGGWIELVEIENQVKSGGPATTRLLELLLELAGSRGLDRSGVLFRQLDQYLRDGGLVEVHRRDVDVPLGEWGGRIGSLMASDLRALYMRLSDVFQARLGVPADESRDLITAMSTELNEHRTVNAFGVAFGRKPI
jgi:SAM-dependent methyltransferase